MAGSSRYTVILDANVLYPNLLRDILLSLAVAGLYHARWTTCINDEWSRNLVANRPDIEPKIGVLLEQVNAAVPDCLVENYEYLIASLTLPDANDRHVLAAAIVGHEKPPWFGPNSHFPIATARVRIIRILGKLSQIISRQSSLLDQAVAHGDQRACRRRI